MTPIHAPTPPSKFMRGAFKTPRHKLLGLAPYRVTSAPPPQFGIVPIQLDVWGNRTYGDCVTAEEAFAKAWWSTFCGLPELFVPASEVIRFANQWGYLNGATLTEVMDTMQGQDGFRVGGKTYNDGAYYGVDYSNEFILQSALDPGDGNGGPIKIAIDADALPGGAGNQNGWFSTSGRQYNNIDHCVAIAGYGRADYLYDLLRVGLPSGLSPSTPGYLLFTWGTIGFVTHDWIMGTCVEAYVRNPTTPGQSPTPTPPPVPPVPPVPPSPPIPEPHEGLAVGVGSTLYLPGGRVINAPFPIGSIQQFGGNIFVAAGLGGAPRVVGYDVATEKETSSTFFGDPNSRSGATLGVFNALASGGTFHAAPVDESRHPALDAVKQRLVRRLTAERLHHDHDIDIDTASRLVYDNTTDALMGRAVHNAYAKMSGSVGGPFIDWLKSLDWAGILQIVAELLKLLLPLLLLAPTTDGESPMPPETECPPDHLKQILGAKPVGMGWLDYIKMIQEVSVLIALYKSDKAAGKDLVEIATDLIGELTRWLATNPISL